MKLRVGKGTVGVYLAISALLPLAIYMILSVQARHAHERQAQTGQVAQTQPAQPGRSTAGPAATHRLGTAIGGATHSAVKGAWGDGKTSAGPPDDTDPPARGAPYNWTFMGYSAVLMFFMLLFVLWLIRRATRARDAETRRPASGRQAEIVR